MAEYRVVSGSRTEPDRLPSGPNLGVILGNVDQDAVGLFDFEDILNIGYFNDPVFKSVDMGTFATAGMSQSREVSCRPHPRWSERVGMDAGSGRHEIISEAEQGAVVYQERFDRLRVNGVEIEMQCVGVFHVKDGKVALWRDYFDLNHWISQRGQLGIEFKPPWEQQ